MSTFLGELGLAADNPKICDETIIDVRTWTKISVVIGIILSMTTITDRPVIIEVFNNKIFYLYEFVNLYLYESTGMAGCM